MHVCVAHVEIHLADFSLFHWKNYFCTGAYEILCHESQKSQVHFKIFLRENLRYDGKHGHARSPYVS